MNMKKIFTQSKRTKKDGDEIDEISLDILLAHKEDVQSKVIEILNYKSSIDCLD